MREPGYYWVRTSPEREPEVGLWDGDYWLVCGYDLDVEIHQTLSERLVLSERLKEPTA